MRVRVRRRLSAGPNWWGGALLRLGRRRAGADLRLRRQSAAEAEELDELGIQVGLGHQLDIVDVGGNTLVARSKLIEERGARGAQLGSLAHVLRLEVRVVAVVVANSRDNGIVTLAQAVQVRAVAPVAVVVLARARRGRGRGRGRRRRGEVRRGRLRMPVARSYGDHHAVDNLYDLLLLEDVEAQAEGLGVQVEVTFGRRVVAGLVVLPDRLLGLGSRDTELRLADVLVHGRILPDVARIGLRGAADEVGRAAPRPILVLSRRCQGSAGSLGGLASRDGLRNRGSDRHRPWRRRHRHRHRRLGYGLAGLRDGGSRLRDRRRLNHRGRDGERAHEGRDESGDDGREDGVIISDGHRVRERGRHRRRQRGGLDHGCQDDICGHRGDQGDDGGWRRYHGCVGRRVSRRNRGEDGMLVRSC